MAAANKLLIQGGGKGSSGGPTVIGTGVKSPHTPHTFANINVREFFETQSVEVTKETKRKIKQEIERKREELRVLVGERYRDLIDAADTIGTMRLGSSQVFNKLTNLRTSLISLPIALKCTGMNGLSQAIGSGGNNAKRGDLTLNGKELELAAELKLTTTVPRQIRVCMEKDDIVGALHLTILYKDKLDPQQKSYKWSILESRNGIRHEPGMSSEDNTSQEMVESLLDQCDNTLDDFSTPSVRLAEAIIVKQILKKCSCEDVINGFLSRRVELCEKALETSTSEDFVSKVASSVLSLNQIFIDPELYNSAAKKVRKAKLIPEILGLMSSYIPACLIKMNGDTISVHEPPRVSNLAEAILKYYVEPLKSVLSGKNINSFLDHPKTLKGMDEIRSVACSILKRDTEDLMRIVLGESRNIWEEVFATAFTVKCQQVVTAKVKNLLITLRESTTRFQASDVNFDLVSFTWKAGIGHMPNHVINDLFLDETLKLKYLTPSVVQLCLAFETDLQKLLTDFQSLVDNPLKEFISTEISAGFETFINGTHPHEDGWNLFLGRFTATIPESCPTLWKLLNKNDGFKIKLMLSSKSEKWWGEWTHILLKEFEFQLEERVRDLSSHIVATFMPVGEVYKAEGEDFQPSIRVPLQLTHSLHSLLSSTCLKLSQVGPQSIPKNVRDNLRYVIGETIISRCNKLAGIFDGNEERILISPQMAIQFIFDLKFIQWFHPKLGGDVEPLSVKLQSVIDPFDWDICNPRLTLNLKRFLFENHLTLGLLFSEESHGFIAQNFKTKQNQSIPVSNAILSIPLPLLPI